MATERETAQQGSAEPQKREQLLSAVRQTRGAAARAQDSLVFVWPNLVVIEFIAALLMTLSLIVMSIFINAPLEAHANPDRTPNPSKAPWYFLNLQELLLHMHPALAGVIIPLLALLGLAALPYIDRDVRDVGKWMGTRNAWPVFWFSAIYTLIILPILIIVDEFVGVKPVLTALADAARMPMLADVMVSGVIVPMVLMIAPIVLLVWLLRRIWHVNTRELFIGLFTGFVVTYFVLTFVGTVLRGPGMHLYLPWDMPPRTE